MAVLARPGFDATPSLYRDDAWTALVTKTHGLSEFMLVAVTAPGFAALLKGWLAVIGFDEWKAQLLPLLFAIATPPLLYLVLLGRGLARVAAATGAFLLAVSPEFVAGATRVKQYSLDAFCVVCLLGLAWWLLDHVTSTRRWRLLALAGAGALVLSSPSVVVLVTAFGVGLIGLWREDRSRLRAAFVPVGLAGAFAALWWLLVLHPAVSPALTSFWRGYYLPLGDGPKVAMAAVSVTVGRVFTHATVIREGEVAAALFAVAYLVVLWRRFLLGLLLLGPPALAFLFAAFELAPLGTGRTDTYLYPALTTAVAVAVHPLARRARRLAPAAALSGAAALLALAAPTPVYPYDEIGPLVAEVEAKASPSDAIVAYPLASYQLALYTGRPISFRRTDTTATGFTIDVRREGTYTPAEAWPRDALNFAAAIDRARRGHDSVWVLVTPTGDPLINRPSGEGAGVRERFRRRWEDFALPYALRAVRRAYGRDVPPEPLEITFQEYVGHVMRRAGYRQQGTAIVRPRGSLTHWQR